MDQAYRPDRATQFAEFVRSRPTVRFVLVPPMHRNEAPIHTPCGADWSSMKSADESAVRLCSACDKTVHDLSAMTIDAARDLLASGPACVRYLYDASGNVLRGPLPRHARIVPASALLSRAAKSKWLAAAMMAASAIVFEACGGNNGMGGASGALDEPKRPAADPRPGDLAPDAGAGDAAPDASDVDASESDASDSDAGP